MLIPGRAYHYPGLFAEIAAQFKDIHPADIVILEAESLSVDKMRSILTRVQQKPLGELSLLVIDKVVALSEIIQNTLLKLLEEPPNHLVVLLAGQSQMLLPTVKSRLHLIGRSALEYKTGNKSQFGASVANLTAADLKKQLLANSGDRGEVMIFLVDLLRDSRQLLFQRPELDNIKRCRLIDQTILALERNVNLKLSLDNLILNWPQS